MTEPTIQDLRTRAEVIITDMENWSYNQPQWDDSVYRIRMDDDTCIDTHYKSSGRIEGCVGRVSAMGACGAVVEFESADYEAIRNWIVIRAGASGCTGMRIDVDCNRVACAGEIPYDMSLFGGHTRLIH